MKKSEKVSAKNGAKNSIASINETSANKAEKKPIINLVSLGNKAKGIIEIIIKSEAKYLVEQIKRQIRLGEVIAETRLKGESLDEWSQKYLAMGSSNALKYKKVYMFRDAILDIATKYQLQNATLNDLATFTTRLKGDPKGVDKCFADGERDIAQINTMTNPQSGGNGRAKKKSTDEVNSSRLKSPTKAENWAEIGAALVSAYQAMTPADQKLAQDAIRLVYAEVGVGLTKKVKAEVA